MLSGRAELRQDWADQSFYKKGRIGVDKNQTTIGVQAIYTF
jgi:hypothetical protein